MGVVNLGDLGSVSLLVNVLESGLERGGPVGDILDGSAEVDVVDGADVGVCHDF